MKIRPLRWAQPAHRRTLKSLLLWWLIPALVFIMLIALWLSNYQLREQVDRAYDRALAGALRSIDHNISTASGGLSLEQPYLMLEFFELTANGSLYYRVATEDGLAEIGNQDLPLPKAPLISGQAQFFNAEYQGLALRIAAMARPMDPPLYNNYGGRVVVQVAEAIDSRQSFLNQALLRSVERDILVILIVVLVVVWSVFRTVRPLERLRQDVEKRSADDLRPVDAPDIPGEVAPLVDAVNRHMSRYTAQARLQRQFLDDASHQLRTPLSVLRTQTAYALRESDPAEIRAVLLAMQDGLDRAVRATNQMLALARAKNASFAEAGLMPEDVDLVEIAEGVIRTLLPAARARHLDLGLEASRPVRIQGIDWLLREALSNLVDNAIRYTAANSEVTVRVYADDRHARVTVQDHGPGMSASDISQATVRFRRGAAGKNKSGAGLGLAIVGTIVELHGGKIVLENRDPLPGLRAALVFTVDSFPDAAMRHEIAGN
ncbi:sensor histidine kinase [Bordetella tumulicola]